MSKKILFIDDEPEFVRPQVTALEEAGYQVVLETDPDAAINHLHEQTFHLIILDLIMPPQQENGEQANLEPDLVETGIKLYQEIRDKLSLKDVPIIFLTVVRDQDILRNIRQRERGYGQKAHFLTKPISSGEVVAEVHRALGNLQVSKP